MSPTSVNEMQQFLDYAASQDEPVLMYKVQNMVLAIHSNAS